MRLREDGKLPSEFDYVVMNGVFTEKRKLSFAATWKYVQAGLDRSANGWDSVMLTYTSLLRVSGKMLCFYNGNGFGRAGFGYAVAEDSGGSQARAVA